MIRSLVLVLVMLLPGALWAVQPDEILSDPVLEERARDISKGLRCPLCQNESIDESNADISRDLRLIVRERLVAGDTDEEVVEFVVDRYGEFVLLQPTFGGANWLLWAAGPMMLALAVAMGGLYLRGRSSASAPQDSALTPAEREQLKKILDE